jgi:aminopeptidase YwaD
MNQQTAEQYLKRLCVDIPNRRVGSAGNRAATDLFAEIVVSFGFQTECQEFDCIDWAQEGAYLAADSVQFEAFPSPYSLGCQVAAPLAVVSTVEELEAAEVAGAILLMRDELTKEQLMPVNFQFYNPDEHKRIIHLLKTKGPQAIVAATSRNPELAGAVYPFPLFEDGDFDIPSVYMTEEEGRRLAQYAGAAVSLDSRARRTPATASHVMARKGTDAPRRVVLSAHIDTKMNTPGALDNAAGVVTLLLLAELLQDYEGATGVELVPFNGEDYYASPGELLYLARNQGRLGDIVLAVNLDGLGHRVGSTAYSLYGCPDQTTAAIRRTFSAYASMTEGEPWYQGDHSMFLQNGVPALAITSGDLMGIETAVAHTPQDRPELVDCARLVHTALALRDLLADLSCLAMSAWKT